MLLLDFFISTTTLDYVIGCIILLDFNWDFFKFPAESFYFVIGVFSVRKAYCFFVVDLEISYRLNFNNNGVDEAFISIKLMQNKNI